MWQINIDKKMNLYSTAIQYNGKDIKDVASLFKPICTYMCDYA